MERSVVAFAPGHISGYFKRQDGSTPEQTGSLGAGIVIDKGVTITMKPSKTPVATVSSGEHPHLLLDAMDELGVSASITATADMPIGAGFGMSGAGLLATAFAANTLFDLSLTEHDMIRFAHIFEVEHGTGLGDVAASAGYGIDIRTAPGIDGVTYRIPDIRELAAVSLGPLPTPSIITSQERLKTISNAFPTAIPTTLEEMMINSRTFAEHSGLISPKIKSILELCDANEIPASMTMLGEGVFAFGKNAKKILSRFGTVYTFSVAKTGPVILKQ